MTEFKLGDRVRAIEVIEGAGQPVQFDGTIGIGAGGTVNGFDGHLAGDIMVHFDDGPDFSVQCDPLHVELDRAEMTLTDVRRAVDYVIEKLNLGSGSVRRSSAYHDYVALEFAAFATPHAVRLVESRFKALCVAHGWQCCRVTGDDKRNAIFVTMHVSEIISTGPAGDRRMSN